jgi:hypothetical protein
MTAFDRVLDGIKRILLLSGGVNRLSTSVTRLSDAVADLDRRLIRPEAALEMASRGGFRAPPAIEGERER